MMLIAMTLIFIAFLFYSISIWSERFKKILKRWMIKLFIVAFSCDLVGTSIMFFRAEDKLALNPHIMGGYAALIIMGIHLALAGRAFYHQGQAAHYFHRFSIWAWMVWLFALGSGFIFM